MCVCVLWITNPYQIIVDGSGASSTFNLYPRMESLSLLKIQLRMFNPRLYMNTTVSFADTRLNVTNAKIAFAGFFAYDS